MPETEKFPEEFAQWMLIASANPSSDFVRKRWKAVSETASRIEDSTEEVLMCARMLFAIPITTQAEQAFRQSFVQHDPSFASGSNKLEVQLLAGATLASVMRSDGAAAGIGVLAVLAGSACGMRTDNITKPFVEVAKYERGRIAAVDDASEEWPKLGSDTIEAIEAGSLPPTELNKVAEYVAEVSEFGNRVYARLREESAIAWWVLGEYSNDFDKPVKDISPKALPITLAKELADLTRTEVGPVSASAVLWRMLKLHKKVPDLISLGDSIDALPANWLSKWFENIDEVDALTPVILAARLRDKAQDRRWRAGFPKAVGLATDLECTPLQLATQLYFECLLVAALSQEAE